MTGPTSGSSFLSGSTGTGVGSPSPLYPTAIAWGPVLNMGAVWSPGAPSGLLPSYPGLSQGTAGNYYDPNAFDLLVATGQTMFDVEWSVKVTDSDKLTDPKIEQIRLAQAPWD